MSKKISRFRFKQFAVSHHRSSMKVGVDGVLIGCWADVHGAKRIIDVGTGCGLIALIMAQRAPEATIDAIDIDSPSIEEAQENFLASPWADRLKATECPYSGAASLLGRNEKGYDVIISNPPYFDSGVTETVTAREKARHQGELSPLSLLEGAVELLNADGMIAMVVPTEIADSLEENEYSIGLTLERKCHVRGHKDAPFKRVLLQWRKVRDGEDRDDVKPEYLTLELAPGEPTDEYRSLCKDFYLRF